MKRIAFSLLSLAIAVSVGACAKNNNNPPTKPIPGPTVTEKKTKKKKRVIYSSDSPPVICFPKGDAEDNAVYATMSEVHPGYVKSPYDLEHRLIDVRGLPPGTEAECPYTRRTFLVPPW